MLTLLKSLVIPPLEYHCQLWNPWKAKTYKLSKLFNERLHTKSLKSSTQTNWKNCTNSNCTLSMQRRRARYIIIYRYIIYIWKITQNTVPNIDSAMEYKIETRKHQRHGTQHFIPYPTNRNPAQSLQENAITVFGPRRYYSL